MLIRPRRSRIYYLRKFFDYPITLTANTIQNLGLVRMARVGTSYCWSRVHQIKPEKSLEDFLINRFGRELYLTFFKSYTEKVWGMPCHEISAEWGAQRIKGLSLTTAVKHFLKKAFSGKSPPATRQSAQKGTETSLIERFMYPKFGPGQLWEHVADLIRQKGGEIHMQWKVDKLNFAPQPTPDAPLHVTSLEAVNATGERRTFAGDYFFSTMPMRELLRAMDTPIPANVLEVSDGLQYRDFITVGLLADHLKVKEPDGGLLKDTWIYIQEPDVLLGRLQIFNNWSPYLVSDPTKVWIGLEYFCYDTDDLWKMPDDDLKKFAIAEVARIGILEAADVSDAHVVRVPKTYPAYFGTYARFDELKRLHRPHRKPLPGRPQRHAQIQQPGPQHAHRHARRRRHRRRPRRQTQPSGRSTPSRNTTKKKISKRGQIRPRSARVGESSHQGHHHEVQHRITK